MSPGDFNSLGARRGNHEVMMRGTFANVRLKNEMAPGSEGSATTHLPSGDRMSIYDAGMRYQDEGVPLVILAGAQYGTGSSRDWAAKGTRLLGAVAVIAESYERIHRSNLIGFGVLPLEYADGDTAESLGLTGQERFTIGAVADEPSSVSVRAPRPTAGRPSSSRRACASTPRPSGTTSGTAASCTTCSGISPHAPATVRGRSSTRSNPRPDRTGGAARRRPTPHSRTDRHR